MSGGADSPICAGFVLEKYSWSHMFVLVFIVNASGALIYGTLSSATSLDSSKKDD